MFQIRPNFTNKRNLRLCTPRLNLVLVARDLESDAALLHTNDSNVRETNLVRWSKYFRHFDLKTLFLFLAETQFCFPDTHFTNLILKLYQLQ